MKLILKTLHRLVVRPKISIVANDEADEQPAVPGRPRTSSFSESDTRGHIYGGQTARYRRSRLTDRDRRAYKGEEARLKDHPGRDGNGAVRRCSRCL